jgi:uncharacterized protein YegL
MTDPKKTLIAVLLDRSGSMAAAKADTEGGFDQFIAKQREQPGAATVTLAQFDHKYELVYSDTPIADVPPLDLEPRGRTALYDGIGKLTTDIGEALKATPEDQRPGTVIVVILTDGHENASREWDRYAIKDLIQQQQDRWQWTYIFLGATLDAVDTGDAMGIPRGHSMSYTQNNTAETFSVMDSAATATRAGTFTGFSTADREAASGE